MESNNIFMSTNEIQNDISGKVTYTNLMEIIPSNKLQSPLTNWKNKYKTEWRWRFLKFINKEIIEISYIKYNSDTRIYFNRYGEWVHRNIDSIYDQYVDKEYYYYT